MTEEDYEKFEDIVGEAINRLRDEEEWSDQKVARFLREEARSLDPPKPRKKVIDPLTITEEEIAKYPLEVQEKIKKARDEQLTKLKEMLGEVDKKLEEVKKP